MPLLYLLAVHLAPHFAGLWSGVVEVQLRGTGQKWRFPQNPGRRLRMVWANTGPDG